VRIERVIEELRKQQQARAVEYFAKPNRRDTFEYGERCGLIQGLKLAEQVIEQLLSEEDESGKIRR